MSAAHSRARIARRASREMYGHDYDYDYDGYDTHTHTHTHRDAEGGGWPTRSGEGQIGCCFARRAVSWKTRFIRIIGVAFAIRSDVRII